MLSCKEENWSTPIDDNAVHGDLGKPGVHVISVQFLIKISNKTCE